MTYWNSYCDAMAYKYENMLPDEPEEMEEEVMEGDFYINPATGSIATVEEWEKDFENREDKTQTWEQWGGETLLSVIFKNGEWIDNA